MEQDCNFLPVVGIIISAALAGIILTRIIGLVYMKMTTTKLRVVINGTEIPIRINENCVFAFSSEKNGWTDLDYLSGMNCDNFFWYKNYDEIITKVNSMKKVFKKHYR